MKTKIYIQIIFKRGDGQTRKTALNNSTLLILSALHSALLKLKLITKHPSNALLSIVSHLVPGIGLEPIRSQ